jgi:hypothetical protein
MNNTVYTENYRGYTINVWVDEDVESPEEWGNEDMCGWINDFTVKNKWIDKDVFGAIIGAEGFKDYKEQAKEVQRRFHIFGIDAYIHSGISLSMHNEGMRCRWDTSNYVGCILVEKKEARLRKSAEKIARGILKTWNDYLSGNIYGYTTENENDTEFVGGSCGGYYGDYETSGILDDARREIDVRLEELRKEKIARTKVLIKNNVPLQYRG